MLIDMPRYVAGVGSLITATEVFRESWVEAVMQTVSVATQLCTVPV